MKRKNNKNNINKNTNYIFNIIIKILKMIKSVFDFIFKDYFQLDKVCLVKEDNKNIYSLKNNELYFDENEIKGIKKIILLDSLIELKLIKVPIVEKSILKNIVINTVKKHSMIIPNERDISYTIVNKEEKQYEILVFIKQFPENFNFQGKRLFSTYHVISNLIKYQEFPDDSSFITNVSDVWFLYSFKEKKFRKRAIYYKEDLKNFKRSNIYYVNLFLEKNDFLNKNFTEIPVKKINKSLLKLKDDIFKEQKKIEPRILAALTAGFLSLLLIFILEIFSFRLELNKKRLISNMNELTVIYDKEKAKRGIGDELYKEFIKLVSKKSNVNDFFKNLYLTGKDNIQIERLYYNEGSFTISGYCDDDSKLEDFFRKTKFWKDVNFSFSRKSNKIIFNITGKFIDE